MSQHKDSHSSRALELGRIEAAIARTVPEMIPALCWIIGNCQRSRLAEMQPRPPLEELAAVVLIGGARVRDVLGSTKRGSAIIERLPDITGSGLLVVRASAAQRLGLGVESVLPIGRRGRRW